MIATSVFRFLTLLPAAVVFVLGMAMNGPVYSQQRPPSANEPVRFAVIDVQKILRDAAATRTIRPQVEKLKDEYQTRFKKEEDELRVADQELQNKRALLSPEAFDQERRAFQSRATELQRQVQEARRSLDEVLGGAMSVVQSAIEDIVKQYAEEQKIQFILHRPVVMRMDARFDITDEVLKRLNARLPSVTVKLPERKPGASPR